MLSYIKQIAQLTVPQLLKQDGVPLIKSSSFHSCTPISMTRPLLLKLEKDKHLSQSKSGSTHSFVPSRHAHVVKCRDKNGRMIDSKHVTERFLRLGNGIWLKRHRDYEEPSFFKIARHGPKYIRKTQQHTICAAWMASNLDKLVTRKFKRHRWTVTDPYAGYDETVKFYYNPFKMPGVNEGKRQERRAKSWVRYQEYLELSSTIKRRQLRHPGQSNRQKPILTNKYFN